MITKERDAELKAMAEMRYKASFPNSNFRELALKRTAGTITPMEDQALEHFYAKDGAQGVSIPLSLNNEEEAKQIKYHFLAIANAGLAKALEEEGKAVKKTGKKKSEKQIVKRAIEVTQASKDFGKTRPTIYKWEQGKGNPPQNFTLADVKIYTLCLQTYRIEQRFNSHVTESLKNGNTFNGRPMSKPRTITRPDIGSRRERDMYQTRDPMED